MKLGNYMPRAKLLRAETVGSFTGGLNTEDDDELLTLQYATRASNVRFTRDGVVEVRPGVQKFAQLPEGVVDVFYYGNAFVAVTVSGQVFYVTGDGTVTRIWDQWGPTEFVSFVPFNGDLYIHNGINKPIVVKSDFSVAYSVDPVSGSNANTPIGRYAIAAGRYHVVAGDPAHPQRVYISMRDAPATWLGDPEPNDATQVDVGSSLAQASEIRGLLWFRGYLLVLFPEGVVVGQLGIYNAGNEHTPDFSSDAIEGFGCVAHRTAVALGDDGFMLDYTGVNSLRRTVFNDTIKPEQASRSISREVTTALSSLTENELERCFAVLDVKDSHYTLFLPNGHTFNMYIGDASPRYRWSKFTGLDFTCGTRTLTGTIVFGKADGSLWVYGNRSNPIYLDDGLPIPFEWELPWTSMRMPTTAKNLKYLSLSTRGEAEFTASLFCDRYVDAPMASMSFSGGDQGGFGSGPQPYGGGRNTNYQKLWAVVGKFIKLKLRVSGAANAPLRFVSATFTFQVGSIRR